eukprot:gene2253-3805_t
MVIGDGEGPEQPRQVMGYITGAAYSDAAGGAIAVACVDAAAAAA